MQKKSITRKEIPYFTKQQNDLAYHQEELVEFIATPIKIENFQLQIAKKTLEFEQNKRDILAKVLHKQYHDFLGNHYSKATIDRLKNQNTFTVTTGHQLNIFTGPIYFIYKILHTIKLSEELNKKYPKNHFIPVFWMAGEDHDFDEIKSTKIFRQELEWHTHQKGAVGRFKTENWENLHDEFLKLFQNAEYSELKEIITFYNGETLLEATFNLVNKLFKDFPLLIINGDHPELKKEFLPIFKREFQESFSFQAVINTNKELAQKDWKIQVNPREINLFYLTQESRERIEKHKDGFFIKNKGILRLEEILSELEKHPENFSPNVILRPLYQEFILPNLAYIGGVGEINYWVQLKAAFEKVNICFPMIGVRNSLLLIDSNTNKKIQNLELDTIALFQDFQKAFKNYLAEKSPNQEGLLALKKHFSHLEHVLEQTIVSTDIGLSAYAKAEQVKLQKQIQAIEEKIIRTQKIHFEQQQKQIQQVFTKLFPDGKLQERSLNFFELCSNGAVYDKINNLYQQIDPFNPDFIILYTEK